MAFRVYFLTYTENYTAKARTDEWRKNDRIRKYTIFYISQTAVLYFSLSLSPSNVSSSYTSYTNIEASGTADHVTLL